MDRDYEVRLGYYIRSKRKKAGLTQEELAAKLQIHGCDITRSALAKLEVGQRHFYPADIRALHEILEFDYNDFFSN